MSAPLTPFRRRARSAQRLLRILALLLLASTVLTLIAVSTSSIPASTGTARAASKSKPPPCQAAFPNARSKTIGKTTWYNRQESVRMVLCNRFGLDPSADFPINASMVCGVLAQVLGKGSHRLGLFADGACSGADLASDPKEPAKYVGVACGWASDLLGVFVKPLGALGSAGCTLAPSAGNAFGAALESKHEFDVAVDVIRHGRCIKYSPTHFGSPWLAVACADGAKASRRSPSTGRPRPVRRRQADPRLLAPRQEGRRLVAAVEEVRPPECSCSIHQASSTGSH